MVTQPYFPELVRSISRQRLEAYRTSPGDRDVDLIARYNWNAQLCESLYPLLQCTKIALRNAIDSAITAAYNTRWFDDDFVIPTADGIREVAGAKVARVKDRKPLDHDGVISAFSFGFWTHLFTDKYEQGLGRVKPLRPALLPVVLPHAPNAMRDHKKLFTYIDALRKFRNRVSHHEPVSRPNKYIKVLQSEATILRLQLGVTNNPISEHDLLNVRYRQMLQLISWISKPMAREVQQTCRFPAVYSSGSIAEMNRLTAFCLANKYVIT